MRIHFTGYMNKPRRQQYGNCRLEREIPIAGRQKLPEPEEYA